MSEVRRDRRSGTLLRWVRIEKCGVGDTNDMNGLLMALSKACKQSAYPTGRQSQEESCEYRVRADWGLRACHAISLYTLRSDRIRKDKERTTAAQERLPRNRPMVESAEPEDSSIFRSALFCLVLVGQMNY